MQRVIGGWVHVETPCLVIVQVQVKNVVKTWSDLYVNFVRLSALVANAEPNIACEQLMSSIRSFTEQPSTDVRLSQCVFFSVVFRLLAIVLGFWMLYMDIMSLLVTAQSLLLESCWTMHDSGTFLRRHSFGLMTDNILSKIEKSVLTILPAYYSVEYGGPWSFFTEAIINSCNIM